MRSARSLVVVCTLISQIDDNGRLREVINEILNGSVSVIWDGHWPICAASKRDNGYGPSAAYILSKALKDVQFSLVARSDLTDGDGIHPARNDPEGEG